MARKNIFLIVGLLFLCGCAWFSSSKKERTARDLSEPSAKDSQVSIIKKGVLLKPKRLRNGGGLYIAPFRAGEGVEASETLDRIAYMIARGIYDMITPEGVDPAEQETVRQNLFRVVTTGNLKEADFIIDGHVTKVQSPSTMGRWIFRKKKILLGVKGKMIDAKSGEWIVIFEEEQEGLRSQEDHKQLGHRIGQQIGRFILTGINTIE